MTSQTGQLIITIHMLPNISRSKDKKAMKLGYLVESNVRKIFLQKLCRKWDWETSSRPLFFQKKCFIEAKTNGHDLNFNIFW